MNNSDHDVLIKRSNTNLAEMSDHDLVLAIEAPGRVSKQVIDEYYRRCIPVYLDFLGTHWHTGFYRDEQQPTSAQDQIHMIDHLAHLIGITKHDRVLDVGCGIGATICHLNKTIGCEVVGLTPVLEQQKMANFLAQSEGAAINVNIGHAEQLPYPDDSFEVVCFFESACHFEDRQRFFKEVMRVLKPNGRLVGEDWLTAEAVESPADNQFVLDVCKTWAVPMLGKPSEYQCLMAEAGLSDIQVTDMRSLMALHRGFAVSDQQQAELVDDINHCPDPLLRLSLKGIASLGLAFRAQAFTIGQFTATKPEEIKPS